MKISQDEVQQAFADLAIIRRVIDSDSNSADDLRLSVGANLMLQIIAGGSALIILLADVATKFQISNSVLQSAQNDTLRHEGLLQIAATLIVALAVLYVVVFETASKAQTDDASFIRRNFGYLKNLSFLSDLIVKFAAVAIIIHARHPELLSPLLALFLGDYLIQGRFFSLTTKLSLIAGIGCFILAFLLYANGIGNLVLPFTTFCAVSIASIATLLIKQRPAAKRISPE